jgi:hypothetical protein
MVDEQVVEPVAGDLHLATDEDEAARVIRVHGIAGEELRMLGEQLL